MSKLFHSYVMVDWSAASKPATGPDSIWIGVMRRDVRFRLVFESHNPATRREAEDILAKILTHAQTQTERVLLGFDFPLGFPSGLAKALGHVDTPWSANWAMLEKAVKDRPDNANNRYAVGADLNRKLSGEAFPFWGCAARDAQTTLSIKRFREHGPKDLPEHRAVEALAKGAQPVWKLHYNGSVGGQALVGIPVASRLKKLVNVKVWPFEAGLQALKPQDLDGVTAVIAEVWPAVAEIKVQPGEIKDQAQVRSLCNHFAQLDEKGQLGAVFAGAKPPAAKVREAVESEEGWMLGL